MENSLFAIKPGYSIWVFLFGTLPFGLLSAGTSFLLAKGALAYFQSFRNARILAEPDLFSSADAVPVSGYFRVSYRHEKTRSNVSTECGLLVRYQVGGEKFETKLGVKSLTSLLPEQEKGTEDESCVALIRKFGEPSEWRIIPYFQLRENLPEGRTNDGFINQFLKELDSVRPAEPPQPLKIKYLNSHPIKTELGLREFSINRSGIPLLIFFLTWAAPSFIFMRTLPFAGAGQYMVAAAFFALFFISHPVLYHLVDWYYGNGTRFPEYRVVGDKLIPIRGEDGN